VDNELAECTRQKEAKHVPRGVRLGLVGGRSVEMAAADTTTVTAQCSGNLASFRALRSRCSCGETAMAAARE
jgi:hypothetical protein